MRTFAGLAGFIGLLILAAGMYTAEAEAPGPGIGSGDPDAEALRQLKAAGSDLTKVHDVDFYLYLPDKAAAEAVGGTLSAEGYRVTVRLDADKKNWLCLARKAMIPRIEDLLVIRRRLTQLVQAKDGEYDGRETAVQR